MDKAYPKPFDRITVNPEKMGGQPCIRGLRITVRNVMTILASYPERAELFANYPDLEEEDLRQAQTLFVPHLLRRYGALSNAGSSAALRSGRNDKASTKQIPPPAAAE